MRQRVYDGTLSLATSRPGCIIRCVKAPSQQFLAVFHTGRVWEFLPQVGREYRVRANTQGPPTFAAEHRSGVLLSTTDGRPLKNPPVRPLVMMEFEPYFLFECFSLVPAPAPVPARIARRIGRP